MLNHNSTASNNLESQSCLKAIVERFGGGIAKSSRNVKPSAFSRNGRALFLRLLLICY